MRLLLDSHVLVWWTDKPGALTKSVISALGSYDNEVFVSAVTAWELAIKTTLGKLVFPISGYDAILHRAGFNTLPIQPHHGIAAAGLPRHHKDPFDRMLIAQAVVEQLTLVTSDAVFARYDVRLFE